MTGPEVKDKGAFQGHGNREGQALVGVLSRTIEAGYPYYRRAANLPYWLLPEPQLARMTQVLGDEGIDRLADGLIDTVQVKAGLIRIGQTGLITEKAWQTGMGRWECWDQVGPGAIALLAAGERLLERHRRGLLHVETEVVGRALAVLFLAPLLPTGERLVRELATLLQVETMEIAGLVSRYTEIVLAGDLALIDDIDRRLQADPLWGKWAVDLVVQSEEFPIVPKAVAVTPPSSPQVTDALVSLMRGELR